MSRRIFAPWRAAAPPLVAALLLALFVNAPATLAQPVPAPEYPAAIDVQARTIDAFKPNEPEQRRFGRLEFRGGLELKSSARDFGGFSGLRMERDGKHFVAVTDKGFWLTGRIVYDRQRPTAIAEAAMAPLLGFDGRPLAARGWYDAESLAEDRGTLYVGLERVNRIVKFDFARHGVLARGEPVPTPPGLLQALPHNRGIEGLVVVPKGMPTAGALIAPTERALDHAGNLRAFLIGGPKPGTFAIRRTDDFDVSDAALAPSGDLLLLERRFSWMDGVAIRLRRIALSSVVPGALVDGPVLMFADMGYEIDNMEALGIHRTAQGETVLTLLSDDNFSTLQRTLLLQFTLIDE